MGIENHADFSGAVKAKYFAKHMAQKTIALIPHGFALQEGIKKSLGHWNRRIPKDRYLERLQSEVDRFKSHDIQPPKVVLEQGTGWSGCDLVLFYLGGAERILTYDTRPWLRVELLRRTASDILDNLEFLKGWTGISVDMLEDRANKLRASLDLSLPGLLKLMGAEYRVTKDFSYAEVEDESVDLFFSYSTLQRIRPESLKHIVDQSRRVLRPNGVNYHRVHMHDFHHIEDKRVPRFYYLTFGETLWELMTSTYFNYQNRLRLPEFLGLFDGFRVETDNLRYWDEDIAYAEAYLSAIYPNFTPEQIVTWQADIFARKV